MSVKRCSNCGRENAPDDLSCRGCGASLPAAEVEEAPPSGAEPEARSVVLRTFSSQMSAEMTAKHLEDSGIPIVLTADDVGGSYPTLHAFFGIRLMVKAQDLPRAEQALREIEDRLGVKADSPGGDTGVPPDAPAPRRLPPRLAELGLFALGLLIGWLAHYAMTKQRALYTGTDSRDYNSDGRPDVWWTYQSGGLVKYSLDRNFDGKADEWTFHSNGQARYGEEDVNFDGRADRWFGYSNDFVSLVRDDFDFDGKPDSQMRFIFGVPVEASFAASNQLGYWRRDFHTNGVVREVHLDRDRDGVVDETHFFDAFGTFLRVEFK